MFVLNTARRLEINRCVLKNLSTLVTRLTFWFIFYLVPLLLLLNFAWLHRTHLFHPTSSQYHSALSQSQFTASQSHLASSISPLILNLELCTLCNILCSVSTPSPLQFRFKITYRHDALQRINLIGCYFALQLDIKPLSVSSMHCLIPKMLADSSTDFLYSVVVERNITHSYMVSFSFPRPLLSFSFLFSYPTPSTFLPNLPQEITCESSQSQTEYDLPLSFRLYQAEWLTRKSALGP